MNNDVAKKYALLVEKLYRRTSSKSIDWELDRNRIARTELGGYIIRLYEGTSSGNPMEYISLSTDFEESIEVISDEDLSDQTPKVGGDTFYTTMEDLRRQAFRQAVGADKALDDILGELDGDL